LVVEGFYSWLLKDFIVGCWRVL